MRPLHRGNGYMRLWGARRGRLPAAAGAGGRAPRCSRWCAALPFDGQQLQPACGCGGHGRQLSWWTGRHQAQPRPAVGCTQWPWGYCSGKRGRSRCSDSNGSCGNGGGIDATARCGGAQQHRLRTAGPSERLQQPVAAVGSRRRCGGRATVFGDRRRLQLVYMPPVEHSHEQMLCENALVHEVLEPLTAAWRHSPRPVSSDLVTHTAHLNLTTRQCMPMQL